MKSPIGMGTTWPRKIGCGRLPAMISGVLAVAAAGVSAAASLRADLLVSNWPSGGNRPAPKEATMRKPAGLLASILLTLSLIPIVTSLISPAPAAAQFNYGSQFGASTVINGAISPASISCPSGVDYGFNPSRNQGGDGAASASDSNTITELGATQTSAASANAPLATVQGYVEAGDGTCEVANPGPHPPALLVFPMGAGGQTIASFYDTYTVSSATLQPGTPVSVTLAWRVNGSFSALAPNGNTGK